VRREVQLTAAAAAADKDSDGDDNDAAGICGVGDE